MREDTRQRYLRHISGVFSATVSDTTLGGAGSPAFGLQDPRGTASLLQKGGRERTHGGCYWLRMRGIGRHISQICRCRGNAVAMKMWYIGPVGGGLIRVAVLYLE